MVCRVSVLISIHVPAWGTTPIFPSFALLMLFQSTFPRGERPFHDQYLKIATNISIHVPAWGTTRCSCIPCSCTHFNPRSRVGNDSFSDKKMRELFISIHVPAWGTTTVQCEIQGSEKFQSTFPRGERLVINRKDSFYSNFNPRSRVGNDGFSISTVGVCDMISIHVPAWGTTPVE